MKRTLLEFARDCGGELRGPDAPYTGVSTDTRTIGRGELFVALRGPHFDGGQFVAAAQAAGAAGAVIEGAARASAAGTLPLIVVSDAQEALTRAASAWRSRFASPVIGVAGSNGKTTTKEMTAAILGECGRCLATRGNLNNHIGVPLTLLRLDAADRFAVIEMGANAPGEVAALVRIARPDVGLITNAGAEHLEGFGSLEGVARAEGEMVAGLASTATAVINADDAYAPLWRGMTAARVLSFGLGAGADFRATQLLSEVDAQGFRTRFVLESPLGCAPVTLQLGGRHNVVNALAAAAAASAAGARLEHVVAGLGRVRPVAGRLNFRRAASGAWIIDDSYNANPSSMRAGIETLAELAGSRWLVVGDMAELGAHAAPAHRDIGTYARACGIERLFATGPLAALAAESFGSGAQWYPDTSQLAQGLIEALGTAAAGVRLLVKGSRVNRLERVVDALSPAPAPHGASSGTAREAH